MKTFILIYLTFCLVTNKNFAQDKIVLKSLDTLEVKIDKVTSSRTTFIKLINFDGPIYELKNTKIEKIIFANGKEESFENYDIFYTDKKNSIELVFSEFSMSRISFAYSRQIGSHINLRAKGGIFMENLSLFDSDYEIRDYINFQTLYFPHGHTKVAFYTGLDYKFGSFTSYKQYYLNNPYGIPPGLYKTENFNRYSIVNGLEINLSQSFLINTYFTLGFLQEVNTMKVNSKIEGGISLGYAF